MSISARRLQRTVQPRRIKLNYGGLYTSQEPNRTSYTPDLKQYWMKVNWADIEPTQGNYDFSMIQNYINSHRAEGVVVRLHVQGGDNAPVGTQDSPGWLANISGGGIEVTNTRADVTGFCGRYWNPAYKAAFADCVRALGAAFDSEPLFGSINLFACSLIYDEPWIMGGDTDSIVDLYNAGLTQATQQTAIFDALAVLMEAFPTTVVEMPTHSQLTWPTATGQGSSWPAGRTQLNTLHGMYGDHIIFTDYGLGPGEQQDPEPLATASSSYAWMHQRAVLGYPIAFQATLGKAGDPDTAASQAGGCDAALYMKACWYEHHDWTKLTNDQVQAYDVQLKANVPGAST